LLNTLEVDYVVISIDQVGKVEDYTEVGEENLSEKGRIIADKHNGLSKLGNVFVAGDICAGNHMSLIGAIASGKRAAVGVRQQLEGYNYHYEGINALLALENNGKPKQTSVPLNMEDDIIEILGKFNLFQSCEKCNHCIDNLGCPAMLKVDGKIVIDQPKCTRCGLCIDVCPNDAIAWQSNGQFENVIG
jgi:heterodisulfide reductase subunit A-like polyferredoxin